MAESPYTLLTIYSSAFTGSATAIVNLEGLYRTIQSVTYTSSDAIIPGTINLTIQKTEEINNPNADGYPYQGTLYYEDVIATHAITTAGAIYDNSKQTFFRYVRATLTGNSSQFTSGSVKVILYFDGPQTPSS